MSRKTLILLGLLCLVLSPILFVLLSTALLDALSIGVGILGLVLLTTSAVHNRR